jgi:hypothetical protein
MTLRSLVIVALLLAIPPVVPGEPNKTADQKQQATKQSQPFSLRTANTNKPAAKQISPRPTPTRQSGTQPSNGPTGGWWESHFSPGA